MGCGFFEVCFKQILNILDAGTSRHVAASLNIVVGKSRTDQQFHRKTLTLLKYLTKTGGQRL